MIAGRSMLGKVLAVSFFPALLELVLILVGFPIPLNVFAFWTVCELLAYFMFARGIKQRKNAWLDIFAISIRTSIGLVGTLVFSWPPEEMKLPQDIDDKDAEKMILSSFALLSALIPIGVYVFFILVLMFLGFGMG